MAIRFNTKKYDQVKAEYLKFIEKGSASASLMREFDVYKIYLDADEDIKTARIKQASKPKTVEPIKKATKKEKKKKEKHASKGTSTMEQHDFFAQLVKKVDVMVDDIKQKGFSEREFEEFLKRLKLTKLSNEQKSYFLDRINQVRPNSKPKYSFSLTFKIKDGHFITLDPSTIHNLLVNRSLDQLNADQIRQVSNTIDRYYARCKTDPVMQKIKEEFEHYMAYERKKQRPRIAVPANPKPHLPKPDPQKTPQQIASDIIISSRYAHLPSRVTVEWKDITFHENVIRIGTPIFNKPILIKKSCRRSYNTIKELLAEKLPEIIIEQTPEGTYKLVTSIELDSAMKLIRRREAEELFYDDAHHRPRLGLKKALLIAEDQESLMRRLHERKQRFINYLISLHCKLDYKVIPAVELLAHESSESVMEEDAFIFTIPSRRTGCVCIVYENVNVARASLLFVVQKEKYMDCLQSIFNYMADEHIRNKRENLRARPTINASGVLSVYHVNHTEDMHDWTVKLKR